MKRVWLFFLLVSSACSLETQSDFVVVAHRGAFECQIPTRYQNWTETLVNDLAILADRFAGVADSRWPATSVKSPLKVVIAANPRQAAQAAAEWGLSGDSSVPRTHPNERLALIPLPRDDALLADLENPPWSFRQSFLHEAAHLLSLDRPGLRKAPPWFQEGFAETWIDLSGSAPADYEAWPRLAGVSLWTVKDAGPFLRGLREQAAEIRLDGWRLLAAAALKKNLGSTPWKEVEEWTLANLKQEYLASGVELGPPALYGRDLAFGVDSKGSPWIVLASLPHRTVVVELPLFLGEDPFGLEIVVGRTGAANAGLDIAGSPGSRIVFDRLGGLSVSQQGTSPSAPVGRLVGTQPLGRPKKIYLAKSSEGDLVVRHEGLEQKVSSPNLAGPPVLGKFWVRDGSLKVVFPSSYSTPKGFFP
ncbi:MAG TPA: hypothetical protein DDW23_00330 [Planctomycetes bacterium]|nr:hypothetical protein [Planctomycetota bacterium]